jgi:uncharacterized membrane protein
MMRKNRVAGCYGLALILLIVAIVFTIGVQEGDWQRLVALTLQGIALFVTLRASEAHRRLIRLFILVFAAAFLGGAGLVLFGDSSESEFVRLGVLAIVFVTLPVIGVGLVRQVKRDEQITVQTMMGVLCAYLLIMTMFAYTYAAISSVSGEVFFNQGEQWDEMGDYLYFSLTTITTVGMGDLTPATQVGRALTGAEALIGQIYMVTVVAVIVGNLGRSRPPQRPEPSPAEASAAGDGPGEIVSGGDLRAGDGSPDG